MQAFVINLPRATERWAAAQATLGQAGLPVVRVPAVDGTALTLPVAGFSERNFRRRHGREVNLREVGCYLSHLAAMRAFLETREAYGLICEDDLQVGPEAARVLTAATAVGGWNVLRVTGLAEGHAARVQPLGGGYFLGVAFGRLKGAGAYVVDRRAAERLVTGLLPMAVPWDHAIDHEWRFGLRAATVIPFPISQTDHPFRSDIQRGKFAKLPGVQRWTTVYPYQVWTEVSRWVARGWQWGRQWGRLRGWFSGRGST